MSTELTTHWSEHDAALATILRSLTTSLLVFDEDLVRLGLERPENVEILRRRYAQSHPYRGEKRRSAAQPQPSSLPDARDLSRADDGRSVSATFAFAE